MKGVQKSFGHIQVLRDIDLEIGYGEIVALIGDNGAGKSTLIKLITGVYAPSAGEIYFKGQRITRRDVRASRALGIECCLSGTCIGRTTGAVAQRLRGPRTHDLSRLSRPGGQKRETEQLMRRAWA